MTQLRGWFYKGGTALLALIGALAAFGILDPLKSAALTGAVNAIGWVLGVSLGGTAAYNLSKQNKEGVFVPAPPENQIIDGLNKLQEQKNQLDAAVGTVTSALSKTTSEVPVLGPLAKQVLDQIVR